MYDKNGNVTSLTTGGTTTTYTYDYRDRMTKSKKGTDPAVLYTYDHTFNRVKKWNKNGNKISLYPFGDYEIEGTGNNTGILTTTNTLRINLGLGSGQSVSLEYNGSGVLQTKAFHHTDHLTGSSIETDASGNTLQTLDYQPFGSLRVNTKTGTYDNKHKFTGKELDTETSLTYFGARYYDSEIGRWMGVDPLVRDLQVKHLVFPQKLNGYGYVVNNSLKNIDIWGLDSALIVYGEDTGRKNPDAWKDKAESRAQELRAQDEKRITNGEKALYSDGIVVVDGRTIHGWNNALGNNKDITLIEYYGHSDQNALYLSEQYLDQNSLSTDDDRTTAIVSIYRNTFLGPLDQYEDGSKDIHVNDLDSQNVKENARIHLWSCNTTRGNDNIAQSFADHFDVPVWGANTFTNFYGHTAFTKSWGKYRGHFEWAYPNNGSGLWWHK